MDITDTLAPNSDQLDAVDLAPTGPQVFTVKSVSKGNPEQPVQVHLAEFPRGPWRPGKNQRRVLAACWGADASAWVGRRVELYCDPDVMFGKDAVGGIRIKRLSHIAKAQQIPLIIARGKSASYTVQPLPSVPDAPGVDASAEGTPHRDAVNVAPEQASGTTPPVESLVAAINRSIRSIQADGGGAWLRTWADSMDVAPSSAAIAARFGESARDLRSLIGETHAATQ